MNFGGLGVVPGPLGAGSLPMPGGLPPAGAGGNFVPPAAPFAGTSVPLMRPPGIAGGDGGGGLAVGTQAPTPARVEAPAATTAPAAAPAQSPLLRIRAGIEAGNAAEVKAGLAEAEKTGVAIAPNVREMITQWLSVNAPEPAAPAVMKAPAAVAPATAPEFTPLRVPTATPLSQGDKREDLNLANAGAGENIRAGEGSRNWTSQDAEEQPEVAAPKKKKLTPEVIRTALLRFFEGAPKGSDAAAGLGIKEGEDGARYMSLPILGKAVGLEVDDEDAVTEIVLACIREAPKGVFVLSGYGAGLCEWAGWDEFNAALTAISAATRDPAFEPRSIQQFVLRTARGAVRAGHVRQAHILRLLQENLSPQTMPDDAAPALRSAIARRTRLALACVVDAIAAQGLGPEAGPDSMGLVGQLPRTLFGHIFDNIDDRDRGACAFLGEVLASWDRRRCFSKRWLQDAQNKFTMPKGANSERDERRGWYALTAENLNKSPGEDLRLGANIAPMQQDEAPKRKASPEKGRRSRSPQKVRARDPKPPASEVRHQQQEQPTPSLAEAVPGDGDGKGSALDASGKKKRKAVQNDDDDDETVAKHLEESRKRRAALMAKYLGDKN